MTPHRKLARERKEADGPLRLEQTPDGLETRGCPLCASLRAQTRSLLHEDKVTKRRLAAWRKDFERRHASCITAAFKHEDASGHYTFPPEDETLKHFRLLWRQGGGTLDGMEALHKQRLFLVKVDKLRDYAA